jgi:hypothetical protein
MQQEAAGDSRTIGQQGSYWTGSGGRYLPAPFGRTTDDLDAMLKRRNIRAIVLINPIGFYYSNG